MTVIFTGEGDLMVRCRVVWLLCLVLLVAGWLVEGDGLSGTVGAEAAFLPGFATDLWVDLDWSGDGWSFGSLAELSVFPAFGVGWTGSVAYDFGMADLGATLGFDIYPFALDAFDLVAGIEWLDMAREGFTFSVDSSLLLAILPVFGSTLSLDIDAAYGVFSVWADFDLGIPGFGTEVVLGAEVHVLDLDLESGSLTADLGGEMDLVPAFDAAIWLDLALVLSNVSVTAETDFSLTPFDLLQQRLELTIEIDSFTCYAWIGFTGAGDMSAGIGGTVDFP